MGKLHDKSLTGLHDLLVSKEITVVDLIEETLDRIQDTGEQLGSFITINKEKAIALAKAIDLKGTTESNLLAGIPIGIKDNIVTKNILTTAGSRMLYNFDPIYDVTVMDKAYQADMIPVEKLNMDEFAIDGSMETSHFKKTKGVWGQAKVPGGPPGGSASAVAAGQVPISLKSDTGGNIRQPAAFNGIMGLEPTYERVSRFGLIAFASSLDQIGPLTRNVKDNASILNAVSGYDEKDSTSTGVSTPGFATDLTGDARGVKIALPEEYLGEGVQPDVRKAVLKAAETLKVLGAIVEEVNLPHSKYGITAYYIIASSETSSNLRRFDGIRYGYRSENVQNLEDVYVNSRSEGSSIEVKRRVMLGTFSSSAGYYGACFREAGQIHALIKQDFKSVFTDYDLVTDPLTPTVAFDSGKNINGPITMHMYGILTVPVNLAGLPGMLIPAGLSEGLSVGLQIIGKHFGERTMYKTTYTLEQATDFHTKKPVILGGNDQ